MKLNILDINNIEYLYAGSELNNYYDFSDVLKIYRLVRVIRIYDKKEMLIVTDKIKCVYEVE